MVKESTRHGVLAADGGSAELKLRVQRTEERGKRLAPAHGLIAELFKEFLQGEICLVIICTGSDDLSDRGVDRAVRARVGVGAHRVGVAAPGHDAALLGRIARQHRQQRRHRLRGAALHLAAKGHEQRERADGGVETLCKAAAGRALEAARHLAQRARRGSSLLLSRLDADARVLDRTVRVEERARKVGDRLAAPVHHHAGALSHDGHAVGLQVFGLRGGDELRLILQRDDDGHALLRFGDRKLGTVEALILLAHGVELDLKAVGQLADGDRHTARAEVVAALDEAGDLAVSEQALDLALFGRVALLDLARHGGEGLHIVALRRTGRAADAVTARAAAEQDNDVARGGTLAHNVLGGRRGDDRAALKAFGNVALMVELGDMARGKADLVAVGRISRRRGLRQLALGELSGKRLRERLSRVAAAGDAHRLMDISAAGERVADAASDAGGRTAEGFNFGGVVVGLVFEHQQPVLLLAVHLGGNVDRAGVDLLALVELGEKAAFLERLGADGRDVHERLGALGGLLEAVDLLARGEVAVIRILDGGILDADLVQMRRERRVAAVIGPVGVDDAHLGHGGVAVLFVAEIGLQCLEVV